MDEDGEMVLFILFLNEKFIPLSIPLYSSSPIPFSFSYSEMKLSIPSAIRSSAFRGPGWLSQLMLDK